MRALIVGAGAVGRVLAVHLQRGGSEVALYVRRPMPEAPLRLYDLRKRNPWRSPLELAAIQTIVEGEPAAGHAWDQIFLCVPSDALRQGLLPRLKPHIGDATVVKLQPGLYDRSWLTRQIPEGQLVTGMVTFISYRVPLETGARVPPGFAFWVPPLTFLPFSGPAERTAQIVDALRRGGLAARSQPDVEPLAAFLLALQAPLTAGHACAGESLRALRSGRWLRVSFDAARQATRIVGQFLARRPPWTVRLAATRPLGLLLSVLPGLLPFPFEPFLAAHYGKLRLQSQLHLEDYIHCGRSLGLPVDALEQLAGALTGLPVGAVSPW